MHVSTPPSSNSPLHELEHSENPGFIRRHRWTIFTLLIAALVSAAGMVVWYGRMGTLQPVATGSILRLSTFPMHADADADNGPGMPGTSLSQDQLLILAQVRITNISKKPIQIFDLSGLLFQGPQGQVQTTSLGANVTDIHRLFQAFPALAPINMPPLERKTTIAPGQSAQGLVVCNFGLTPQQWQQRQGFELHVSFDLGPTLVLKVK
jgi:hypothetical protein